MKQFLMSIRSFAVIFLGTAIFICSCKKSETIADVRGPDVNFYVLTDNSKIILFNGKSTTTPLKTIVVTGLLSAEKILAIDFRPNTGQLFAITTISRLYTINLETGAASPVGTTAFAPAINGTLIGFDFNPTVDRIRMVTNTGQNLRLNPETGAVAATDGSVMGAAVTAVAYSQNRAGAVSTVLYDIDITSNKLYRQDPPNNGTLIEVGNLGVDAEASGGFDISSDSAYVLAALTVNGKSGLYSIDRSTGAATLAGQFNELITGLAIPTQPAAYAVSTGNELLVLNPSTGAISFTKPITGLQPGENILGIDMRPATGQLFALGAGRIYTINISTGAATQAGAGTFSTALNGTDFGFDFNPTVDRIRIVSNTGQNLRVNPVDGTVVAVDGVINPASSSISASAYTNNFAGATVTALFDIDAQTDKLVKQDPPNNGTLTDVGPLGINIEASNGFDIGGATGMAYGIFTVNGANNIYSVNLTTGAATQGPAFSKTVKGFTLGLGL